MQAEVLLVGVAGDPAQVVGVGPIDVRKGEVEEVAAVLEIRHGPDERDEDLDLLLLVQAPAAGEAEGDLLHVERAQVGVGVGVAADEHGHVPPAGPAGPDLEDAVGHGVGLVGQRVERQHVDALAPAARRRAEPLVDPVLELEPVRVVVPDEAVGGVEDGLGRAVIPRQDDPVRLRKDLLEAEDVAERGAAEAEDALVVVADDGQVAVFGGQHLDQLELDVVGVLELVDEDVAIAAADLVEDGGPPPEQVDDERHLVLEVDQALGAQERLVGGEHAGDLEVLARRLLLGLSRSPAAELLGVADVVLGPDVLLLQPADGLEDFLDVARRLTERPVVVERQAEQVLAEEDGLVDVGQQPEVRRIAGVEGVVAQDPLAERVEGADLGEGRGVGHEDVDPGLHLAGRLLGEGHGQDLGGAGGLDGDQPGDAVGDDLGLARAGPGDDQQRPFPVQDGPALGGVEALEQDPFLRLSSHPGGPGHLLLDGRGGVDDDLFARGRPGRASPGPPSRRPGDRSRAVGSRPSRRSRSASRARIRSACAASSRRDRRRSMTPFLPKTAVKTMIRSRQATPRTKIFFFTGRPPAPSSGGTRPPLRIRPRRSSG